MIEHRALKTVKRGISEERVVATYRHFKSLRKTGEICGIDKDTVRRILKFHEVEYTAKPNVSYLRRGNVPYSSFIKWLRAQPEGVKLPRSANELAKLSGITANTIRCYFYRRRKIVKQSLESLADLRKLDIELVDFLGETYSSRDIVSYNFSLDRYSLIGTLVARLKDDTNREFPIPDVTLFAKRVNEVSESTLPKKTHPSNRHSSSHRASSKHSETEVTPEQTSDS